MNTYGYCIIRIRTYMVYRSIHDKLKINSYSLGCGLVWRFISGKSKLDVSIFYHVNMYWQKEYVEKRHQLHIELDLKFTCKKVTSGSIASSYPDNKIEYEFETLGLQPVQVPPSLVALNKTNK